MSKVKIKLFFSGPSIKRPLVYELGMKFDVVTNIRRAEITDSGGWVILELDADKKEINNSIKWAENQGVIVTLIEGDFIEG
ncbi:MAG: FeS-binding protein [Chloroflexi bacterium]|nr:FeS-binding protein [Chloroflexota bacterium]